MHFARLGLTGIGVILTMSGSAVGILILIAMAIWYCTRSNIVSNKSAKPKARSRSKSKKRRKQHNTSNTSSTSNTKGHTS
jgi:uncharacterized membrane protein